MTRFPQSSRSTTKTTTTTSGLGEDEDEEEDPDEHLAEVYQQMLDMTLELVQDLSLNIRVGDMVLTAYGRGKVLEKANAAMPMSMSTQSQSSQKPFSFRLTIRLEWGGLVYCPQSDLIHKVLSTEQYEQAMDHLEQIRKLQVTLQCRDWGIPMDLHKPHQPPPNTNSNTRTSPHPEACVACIFQKPELYANQRRRNRRTPFWSSSAGGTNATKYTYTIATQRCDVCGNPVCSQHKINANAGGDNEFFVMCVDCSHDLSQAEHNFHTHHPQLLQNLQRLVQHYTRMTLQLCFCVPNLHELAHQLTHKQKRNGAISLGNSALGFVGAALGVAGAAAMLTPAGPAILLAAVATSATSGTFQGMHTGYNMFLSDKTVQQLADRCLGWHGLCLGILDAVESLRLDVISHERDFMLQQQQISNTQTASQRSSILLSHRRITALRPGQQSAYVSDLANFIALGSYTTTRNAMTGVGVTSAMGASYSQAINTSLQAVPVVGAAFSVGCMAMDANNMAASFKQLNTPAKKAVALSEVGRSVPTHLLATISPEILAIQRAVDELQLKIASARREEERAAIQKELDGLDGADLAADYEGDEDIEKELLGL